MFCKLPKKEEYRILGRQLLRSATSVAANFRASCRARSKKEFFAKMSIVVEEADEALFWIEIFEESELLTEEKLKLLKEESLEILKIVAATRKNSSPA